MNHQTLLLCPLLVMACSSSAEQSMLSENSGGTLAHFTGGMDSQNPLPLGSGGASDGSGGAGVNTGGAIAETGGSDGGGEVPEGACPWPNNGRAAVSLTYDDAMPSQLAFAVPELNEHNLRGTFFLTQVNNDAPWKALLADGHELAAHTQTHPCPAATGLTGVPLENFTLQSIAQELDQDLAQLARLGAPAPYTFAYPCGFTWVGQGQESYVPLVQERFAAARLAVGGETTSSVNVYQVPASFGIETAEQLILAVDQAASSGQWLVFGFHGVGGDWLITEAAAHAALLDSLSIREDVWVAPFGEVAACAVKASPTP